MKHLTLFSEGADAVYIICGNLDAWPHVIFRALGRGV